MVDAPECQPSDPGTGQGCGPAGPGPATAGTGSQTVTRTCRAAGAAARAVDSGSDDRAPGAARTEASGRYRGCTSPGGRCSAAARPASGGELHPGRAGSTSGRRGRRDRAGRGRHRPARADPDSSGTACSFESLQDMRFACTSGAGSGHRGETRRLNRSYSLQSTTLRHYSFRLLMALIETATCGRPTSWARRRSMRCRACRSRSSAASTSPSWGRPGPASPR